MTRLNDNLAIEYPMVTPMEAIDRILYAIKNHMVICLVSPPGIGKSAVVWQAAKIAAHRLCEMRLSLLDPTDLMGIPFVRDGQTTYARPALLPDDSEPTVLFLDEFNRATPSVQNACLQLIHSPHRLNEYQFDIAHGAIILACNREGDGGGVYRVLQAAGNRCCIIGIKPDLTDWTNYAFAANLCPTLIAFQRFTDGDLLSVPAPAKTWGNYETPRQWEYVSDILWDRATSTFKDVSDDIALDLIGGRVGLGSAARYFSYHKSARDLPSIDGIILSPENAAIPSDPGLKFAVASALVSRANDQNWAAILTYTERMGDEWTTYTVRRAIWLDNERKEGRVEGDYQALDTGSDYLKWHVAHQNILG